MKHFRRFAINGLTLLSLLLAGAVLLLRMLSERPIWRIWGMPLDSTSALVGFRRIHIARFHTNNGHSCQIDEWILCSDGGYLEFQKLHERQDAFTDEQLQNLRTLVPRDSSVFGHLHVGDRSYFSYVGSLLQERWSRNIRFQYSIPHWVVFFLMLMLPVSRVFLFVLRRRRLSTGTPRCPTCGYDLRATPHRCPECGRELATRK